MSHVNMACNASRAAPFKAGERSACAKRSIMNPILLPYAHRNKFLHMAHPDVPTPGSYVHGGHLKY